MSDPTEDAERLADAVHVRHGPRGSGAVREAWYALYVSALLGATYGLAVTRGLLLEGDVTAYLNGPLVWAALVGGLVVGAGLIRRAGRVRGPVVPPLPWIDLVATTSIDRALVLRESWRVALLLCTGLGAILGTVVGLAGWITGTWPPPWMLGAALAGAILGWAGACVWLSGQASTHSLLGGWSITGRRPRRQIPIDRLREQSARSRLLHGSVLVGDLRVARLSVHPARGAGRLLRLRSAGPIRTLVRRDILGYRRSPGSVVSALVFVSLGLGGSCWVLSTPEVPIVLPLLAAATTYLGCGGWCEGLRLQADSAGAPALIGTTPRRQALVHLVAPLAASLMVGLPTAVGVTLLITGSDGRDTLVPLAYACGWALAAILLSLAGQVWAAFRGSIPTDLATMGVGPAFTASWYAVPLLLVTVTGGILIDQLAHGARWWPIPTGAVVAAGILLLALAGVDRETDAQRT